MNPNTENNILIGKYPTAREDIKIKIKYTEKHTDL
jgi:hypothetical protein